MKFISALLLLAVSATVPRAAVGQECTASTTCETCVEIPTCNWVADTNQCLSNCPAWPGIVCITDGDPMSCPMAPPIEILPETPAPTDEADSPTDAPEVATSAPTTGTAVTDMPTAAPVASIVTPIPTMDPTTVSPTTTIPTSIPSAMPTIFDPQIQQRCPAGHVAQKESLEEGEICLFCIPEGPEECAVACIGPGQCQCAPGNNATPEEIDECCTANPCCTGCEEYEGSDDPQCSEIECGFVPEGCGKQVCYLTNPPTMSPTPSPTDMPSTKPSAAPSSSPSTPFPTSSPTITNACPSNTTQEERLETDDDTVCLFCIPVGTFNCSVGCIYGPICQCAPPGAAQGQIDECCAANPCCSGCPTSEQDSCQFDKATDCKFIPEACGEVVCFDKEFERSPPVTPTERPTDPPTPDPEGGITPPTDSTTSGATNISTTGIVCGFLAIAAAVVVM